MSATRNDSTLDFPGGSVNVRASIFRAAERASIAPSPRFPRANVLLEVLALADLCRVAATALENLASRANDYEPGTLRREAHGVVRNLVNEFAARVVL